MIIQKAGHRNNISGNKWKYIKLDKVSLQQQIQTQPQTLYIRALDKAAHTQNKIHCMSAASDLSVLQDKGPRQRAKTNYYSLFLIIEVQTVVLVFYYVQIFC